MIREFLNLIFLNLLVSKYFKNTLKRIILIFNKPNKKNVLKINKSNITQIYNDYNVSFMNERSIEIPFTKHLITSFYNKFKNPKILEVGNTLIHYESKKSRIKRIILDKYEVYPGVINEDIKDFNPKNKFDLVFSISTLEHVGSDYLENKEDNKFKDSMNQCLSLLNPNGIFIVTLPLFYRDVVDDYIFNEKNFDEEYFFKRMNFKNDWGLCSKEEIHKNKKLLKYNRNYPSANALFVGIIKK